MSSDDVGSIIRLLESVDSRVERLDDGFHRLNANVDLMRLAYRDLAKEVALIRKQISRCPPDCPYLDKDEGGPEDERDLREAVGGDGVSTNG